MHTRKLIGLSLAALLFTGTGSLVHAQDEGPHDGAIKARQAMFQLRGHYIGILSAMAKEKMEYDAELAAESAAGLEASSNLGQSAMWPEGSDSESDGNRENRALPDIWDNLSDVMEKEQELREAVAELVPVAGNGLDALKGSLGDVGSSCKSCHDDYRMEKD